MISTLVRSLLSATQFPLRFLHSLEMEVRKQAVHLCCYLRCAEVADAAGVGVVDLLLRSELSGFDIQSHLAVGISEGHAAGSRPHHKVRPETV